MKEHYWTISGPVVLEKMCMHVSDIFNVKLKPSILIMGKLSKDQGIPTTSVYTTGVDYAGSYKV